MDKFSFTHQNNEATVIPVKGQADLFSISVDARFVGYILHDKKEWAIVEESNISYDLFQTICQQIKNRS